MILYYAPHTIALASHIALEQSGADYQARRLDFPRGEHRSADYLQVNAKGRVPALVTDRGVLTETPAILAYIAQSFPRSALAPLDDPFRFAEAQAFNSYLCSTVHVAHAHRWRGHRWVDEDSSIEDMKRKVPRTMGECFHLIQAEMLRGPWVMGDDYSICDIYLFTIANWLEKDDVDTSTLGSILDHRRRVAELPAVKKVLETELA